MAIPDYETIMLPLLKLLGDQKPHDMKSIYEELAQEFNLSEREINELYPSGNGKIFYHRVRFAKLYLLKAKLLKSVSRGVIQISDRGKTVLKGNPLKITDKFLRKFEEFVEFKRPTKKSPPNKIQAAKNQKTPKELIEYAFQNYKEELVSEILSQIESCTPTFFETLVIDLLVAMGYGGSRKDAGEAIGQSRDGGIDGIIKEDKLGLDIIYIQAKRWNKSTVGRPEIQQFAGALQERHAKKGIFITNSSFTKDAIEFVKKIEIKIVLIDGESLANYMLEHNIGLTTTSTYEMKQIDSDYFEED